MKCSTSSAALLLCLLASVSPSTPQFVAFSSTPELYAAVDNYLANPSSNATTAALKYGYPMGRWDVSQLTDFSRVFDPNRNSSLIEESCGPRQNLFNEDISAWQVSNAVTMKGIFSCTPFNGDVSQWSVANVKDFSYAFAGASQFAGDLSAWNVGSATNMAFMVRLAGPLPLQIIFCRRLLTDACAYCVCFSLKCSFTKLACLTAT
jgi:Mycoplasma protein of unknown function, DUF285